MKKFLSNNFLLFLLSTIVLVLLILHFTLLIINKIKFENCKAKRRIPEAAIVCNSIVYGKTYYAFQNYKGSDELKDITKRLEQAEVAKTFFASTLQTYTEIIAVILILVGYNIIQVFF